MYSYNVTEQIVILLAYIQDEKGRKFMNSFNNIIDDYCSAQSLNALLNAGDTEVNKTSNYFCQLELRV